MTIVYDDHRFTVAKRRRLPEPFGQQGVERSGVGNAPNHHQIPTSRDGHHLVDRRHGDQLLEYPVEWCPLRNSQTDHETQRSPHRSGLDNRPVAPDHSAVLEPAHTRTNSAG